ncbi:MAG: chromosomal replication initiator protein DnaA [Pseudomonadota bacterium]
MAHIWDRAVEALEGLVSQQDLNLIRPLHAREAADGLLLLLAPNSYVMQEIRDSSLMSEIERVVGKVSEGGVSQVRLQVGSVERPDQASAAEDTESRRRLAPIEPPKDINGAGGVQIAGSRLNPDYTFDKFVEGKSNQLARAAAMQISQNPGRAYNPLFIYGGVGLGKTHLMHSVGNAMAARSGARVAYVHSADFVSDMVHALQHNRINEFKQAYRSLDALLIDDIQFFAGKERSQEEFFHTFNALLEGQRQVILTSDRYPKDVDGLEERLSSRFGSGLTVAIEPPELETSVAILKSKAVSAGVQLPQDVAFMIAQAMRSNVRELEGALRRLLATAQLTGQPITLEFAEHSLKDIIRHHDRNVTIEQIQKTVADYYSVRVADLLSKSRSRSVTRPRQIAMALTKELTGHSLPEIGDAFGGRDHTTVIHAVRKVDELRRSDQRIQQDFDKLCRTLTR